ncbi:MAG TPA: hypothetical protein DHU33_04530 [Firmicutes bacterium]|nr:hypothetical protein [Bacillota bacterium]
MILISMFFIAVFLSFVVLNLNLLVIGYSVWEFFCHIVFSLEFILFILGVFFIGKKLYPGIRINKKIG